MSGRKPFERHLVDGREMTTPEIADMLGITQTALYNRRSELGRGTSYQVIVDMYRANQFGSDHDRSARHMVDGRWMTRAQVAEMLGIRPHTLTCWLCDHKGKALRDAIEYYRQHLQQKGRGGGQKPAVYRVGNRTYTARQVAQMFGVTRTAVNGALRRRGGDMAATIRHYKEREARKRRNAEQEIMRILGY